MATEEKATAGYGEDDRVSDWIDTMEEYMKQLSYEFDDYGEEHVKGPGLYVAFVSDYSLGDLGTPRDPNTWESLDEDRYVDDDELYDELKDVANEDDLAIVVWMNGKLHEYNVRFDTPDDKDDLNYESGMGSRHMSALEISSREEVVISMTLSEEEGTVTKFRDGEKFDELTREEIVDEFDGD